MGFDPATLKYNDQGLIPAIAQDEAGDVLMMAWMNAEAVTKTVESGRVTYWSRSRQAFIHAIIRTSPASSWAIAGISP